jgi:hypothetical protein
METGYQLDRIESFCDERRMKALRALALLVACLGLAAPLAACGGTDQQVAMAKSTQYEGADNQLFDLALQVAQQTYKIGETDPPGHRFVTAVQFYNKEGGRQSAGAGDFIQMSDGSISLQMLVEIVPTEGGKHLIVVTPVVTQVVSGSPKPRELKPDDPYMPGWVTGRVDTLTVEIYEAAKSNNLVPAPAAPVSGKA